MSQERGFVQAADSVVRPGNWVIRTGKNVLIPTHPFNDFEMQRC